MLINMIEKDLNNEMQNCLAENTISKELASSKITAKLYVNTEVKPIATPRSILYHLQERASKVIEDMIKQDIIEEHTINEPAP